MRKLLEDLNHSLNHLSLARLIHLLTPSSLSTSLKCLYVECGFLFFPFFWSNSFQVFPYGSVPLKTYLPDGDIDLTAFSHGNANDALVSDVYAVLRGEEHNEAAKYKVKDVHCIDAEVLPGLIFTLELQSIGLRKFSILHSIRVAIIECMYALVIFAFSCSWCLFLILRFKSFLYNDLFFIGVFLVLMEMHSYGIKHFEICN